MEERCRELSLKEVGCFCSSVAWEARKEEGICQRLRISLRMEELNHYLTLNPAGNSCITLTSYLCSLYLSLL